MKAPIDKVGPTANPRNDIIQIVVSTRCDLFTCSNCTQLLPFRKDAHFMSVDVFRQAVRSLEGWPGVRALFGGNPCSHPKFEDLCQILAEEVPDQRQRGLWTNNLLGKGEVAKKTFWPNGRFNLNVHCNTPAADYMRQWLPGIAIVGESKASWHAPILLDYRDYGLSRADWITAREHCDINQKWSAAIAERHGKAFAYFCEVGAAMDGIRGQNNGIEAVQGWWRFPMMWFHEQVRNCCDAGCGVPLKRKGSLDQADTYDVSPAWREELPVQNHVAVTVHPGIPDATQEVTDYQAVRTTK